MNIKKYEKGQSIVLLMLVFIGLLAIMALSIDGGTIYAERRSAQIAADSAAFSAAYALAEGTDPITAARSQAALNGITHNGSDQLVEVFHPPVSGEYAGNNEYVLVRVTTKAKPVFSGNIFGGNLTNSVEAISRYGTGGGGGVSSLFGDSAVIALCPVCDGIFDISGNAAFTIENGGGFCNSDDPRAFTGSGSIIFNTDTGVFVVGGVRLNGTKIIMNTDITAGNDVKLLGNVNVNGTVKKNTPVAALTYPPPELIIAPPVVEVPTCSGNGSMTNEGGGVMRLTPGNQPARNINGSYSNIIFEPGSYCFSGNLTINGNFAVTADNVQFKMGSKDISFNGNMTFTSANSLFYLTSGSLILNGNALVNLPNTKVYIESGNFQINADNNPRLISDQPTVVYLGSGKLHFNGNSTFTSTNTVYYMNSGAMKWNGNTKLVMSPPTSGIYKGLLVYMPSTNQSTLRINGNSSAALTGSIINVGGSIELIGNSGSTVYHSRIIGFKIFISGNSNTTVTYDSAENYDNGAGESNFVELVQ